MSEAGGAPRPVPRAPRLIPSFLLAIGISGVIWSAAMAAFLVVFDFNSTLGLGPLDDRQATAVFRAHRDDCESLRKWLIRDVGVTDPLRDPLAERFRQDYEAALGRIGAYGMRREHVESEGLRLAIHLGCYGSVVASRHTDLGWTDGPPPMDRPPTAEDPDFTRYVALGEGWFVRQQRN